ncbi:MAG: lysophospholipid acyltransferase family protein [Chloroflexota bacterium]
MDRVLAVPLAELKPEQRATAQHPKPCTVVASPAYAEPPVCPLGGPDGQASRSEALAGSLVGSTFRALLATVFGIIPRLTHDVVVSGIDHISGHHPTIVICNHKRDLDTVVLMSAMYFARKQLGIHQDQFAIGLSDKFFKPGFLGTYWRFTPRLNRIMSDLDLRPVFRVLHAFPIGPVTSRRRLPVVHQPLRQFVELLDCRHDIYWSPEGALSVDGSLGTLRAGLYRIISRSRSSPHLLPVHINYDFTTMGRPRCFVRIGPELPVSRDLRRAEFNRLARPAIAAQMTINAGHVLAACLCSDSMDVPFTQSRLKAMLLRQLYKYRQQGWHIDPRLATSWTFHRRVTGLLAYARKRRILRKTPGGWVADRGLEHPDMRYVINEVSELDQRLRAMADILARKRATRR